MLPFSCFIETVSLKRSEILLTHCCGGVLLESDSESLCGSGLLNW